jgi:hypothetical protein
MDESSRQNLKPQPRDLDIIGATRGGYVFGRVGFLAALALDADLAVELIRRADIRRDGVPE